MPHLPAPRGSTLPRPGRAGIKLLLAALALLAALGLLLALAPALAWADPGTGRGGAEPGGAALLGAQSADPNALPTGDPAIDPQRIAVPLRTYWARDIQRVMPFRWPHYGGITTYFGEVGPLSPQGHSGIDIAGFWGEPVRAAADGNVVFVGWHPAYGNNVIIFHDGGMSTRYGHLAKILATRGERVVAGQLIGSIGSTGYSTGPHLHFEVRQDGQLEDPLPLLPTSARL